MLVLLEKVEFWTEPFNPGVGAGVRVGGGQSKRAMESFGCRALLPQLPLPRMLLIALDFTGEHGRDLDKFRALLVVFVGGGWRNELESKSPEMAAERRCLWPRFTVGGWSVMLIGSASDIEAVDGSCGGAGFVCASEMSDMVLAREGRKKERRNEKERLWCV